MLLLQLLPGCFGGATDPAAVLWRWWWHHPPAPRLQEPERVGAAQLLCHLGARHIPAGHLCGNRVGAAASPAPLPWVPPRQRAAPLLFVCHSSCRHPKAPGQKKAFKCQGSGAGLRSRVWRDVTERRQKYCSCQPGASSAKTEAAKQTSCACTQRHGAALPGLHPLCTFWLLRPLQGSLTAAATAHHAAFPGCVLLCRLHPDLYQNTTAATAVDPAAPTLGSSFSSSSSASQPCGVAKPLTFPGK